MSWTGKAARAHTQARRAIGEPIQYIREGFAVLNFNAVFIDVAVNPVLIDGMNAVVELPSVDVSLSQMGEMIPQKGDTVKRVDSGECFEVTTTHPDGEGEVNCKLKLP